MRTPIRKLIYAILTCVLLMAVASGCMLGFLYGVIIQDGTSPDSPDGIAAEDSGNSIGSGGSSPGRHLIAYMNDKYADDSFYLDRKSVV